MLLLNDVDMKRHHSLADADRVDGECRIASRRRVLLVCSS